MQPECFFFFFIFSAGSKRFRLLPRFATATILLFLEESHVVVDV
jgi:hypothetical protein